MSEHSPKYAYEDFIVGSEWPLGSKIVTAEEIIDFASQFDPQPFHLDEAAGKASILGGLAASGWHTASMFMRMLCGISVGFYIARRTGDRLRQMEAAGSSW